MNLAEIVENRWFWTFWGTMGAYLMMAMKRKKVALPFFGDFTTAYFGITFFFIGFCVQFSLMELFFGAMGNEGLGVGVVYHIIIALFFIFTVKALMKEKWFKPIGFIAMCFFAGMMARSLYGFIWGV